MVFIFRKFEIQNMFSLPLNYTCIDSNVFNQNKVGSLLPTVRSGSQAALRGPRGSQRGTRHPGTGAREGKQASPRGVTGVFLGLSFDNWVRGSARPPVTP